MNVPSTDQELIDHITRLVMDDQPLTQAIDLYVRAVQGRSLKDDVTDSEAYWDTYHQRLVDMVIRSVASWHNAPKQEWVVF